MKRYTLDVGAQLEAPGDGAPKWQLLFPMGATKHRADFPKGKVEFSQSFLDTLQANFQKMRSRHKGQEFALQLNYLHPEEGAPVENFRAAGWISDTRVDAQGLWVLVKWTDEGRERIQRDEFRYLSPEFSFDWQDADTGKRQGPTLWGAALLNTPFLKELPRVAASETATPAPVEATQTQTPPPSGGTNEGAPQVDRKLLCAALGLPEDASDDTILERCKGTTTSTPAPEVEAAKAGEAAAVAKLSEATTLTTKLAEERDSLKVELSNLKAEQHKGEVARFFDGLVKEGRCTPAMRAGMEPLALANGLDAMRFLSEAAPVVPQGEVGVTGTVEPPPPVDARTQWNAAVGELVNKGIPYLKAVEQAKATHPEAFNSAFGK